MFFYVCIFKGMLAFLNNISFFAVGMERIITETESTKKRIQYAIQQGLENGTVKPFDRYILSGECSGIQALKTLE